MIPLSCSCVQLVEREASLEAIKAEKQAMETEMATLKEQVMPCHPMLYHIHL